ncbi:MAG: FtsX-like permease family protein [Elusimicrobia bacterium]|nr:FtsX-like permease family protein [Candidatus Liberimonas magnetica]
MNLIFTIAWRNILRHKGKSLIIGVILLLGSFLMTMGNGVISGMNRGIENNIVNAFMGDLAVISDKQKFDNVLFEMMGRTVEPITNYPQIKPLLQKQEYIDKFLPAGKNLAMSLSDQGYEPGFAFLLGVDFEQYQKMFQGNITVVEGRLLNKNEKGILVPTSAREEYYKYTNKWVIPEGGKLVKEHLSKEAQKDLTKDSQELLLSSSVVLMGMNETNSSTDIRFQVKGVIKYLALNTIFGHFSIADIESYRECLGYFSAASKTIDIPEEEKKLLSTDDSNMDSLFSSGSMFVDSKRKITLAKAEDSKPKTELNIEEGAYNLIFVKLKNGVSRKISLKKLNSELSNEKLGVRAITWNKAIGPVGSMTIIIKSALFVFVTILFCVAIIIIINTLSMSALERSSEIGMMRAIGARKSFIGGMFWAETGMLSSVFGGLGIILGIIAVNIIPILKITSENDMIQLLYGGDTFHPILQFSDITLTIFQLILVTVIAAIYPVSIARSITPLDAIQRD